MNENLPYLLFDIGGTKTRISMSQDGKNFEEPLIYETPQSFDEGVDLLVTQTHKMCDSKIGLVAGGIPGPLDKNKTMVLNAPHLKDWSNKPLKKNLEEKLNAKVYLENDTAMVGLGEAHEGAGKGHRIIAYLTVSTGVNGVRIVNGGIDKNAIGFEIGKQLIDFDKSHDSDSSNFEELVCGDSFTRRYGKKAHEVEDSAVWDEEEILIAAGVHNMICFWSPDVVVIGGAVSQSLNPQKIESYLKKTLTIYPDLPPIKMSELKSIGGLWGSLHYLNKIKA